LFGSNYEVTSIVTFRVVDTASGGYWIRYQVSPIAVKQRKDSSAYLLASLMEGIDLALFAKDGQLHLDSADYFSTKERIAIKLDSITSQQFIGKKDMQYIELLKTELKKDAGLGNLLSPLMLFETYYSSEDYKQFRLTTAGSAADILNEVLFRGDIS
jgi:hypothetical protein